MELLRLRRLEVQRLRNIERAEVELSEGQNLLVGDNGQGKTTLLEAIYLLGATRSFRGARPGELIRKGARRAIVRGVLGARPSASEVVVKLEPGGRQIQVDGKRADLAEHFHRFPMVSFHPGDLDIVFGGPAVRRRFLDRMLFQAQAGYARWYRDYRRALQSRNELLKQERPDREVCAYDPVLASLGARMERERRALTSLLAEATVEVLGKLGLEPFEVRLKASVDPDEEAIREALARALPADRRRGTTTVGPHRDDLSLFRRTGPARAVASRGEARALAVALRLAERQVIANTASSMPLLLLDDLWAELDRERARRVLAMVAEASGQVVVTGTSGVEPGELPGWKRFLVAGGKIELQGD